MSSISRSPNRASRAGFGHLVGESDEALAHARDRHARRRRAYRRTITAATGSAARPPAWLGTGGVLGRSTASARSPAWPRALLPWRRRRPRAECERNPTRRCLTARGRGPGSGPPFPCGSTSSRTGARQRHASPDRRTDDRAEPRVQAGFYGGRQVRFPGSSWRRDLHGQRRLVLRGDRRLVRAADEADAAQGRVRDAQCLLDDGGPVSRLLYLPGLPTHSFTSTGSSRIGPRCRARPISTRGGTTSA